MTAQIREDAAALAEADRLDAAGRHTEAIDVMAGAVKRGCVTSMTRIGARIMVGDRAPMLGEQGAGLIEDAANAGGGEAAALMAVLRGAGVYRTADWGAALDWLTASAERGFGLAQGALAALAGAEAPDGKGQIDWRAMRDQAAAEDWSVAPDPKTLSGDPQIRAYSGFVTPAAAAWMIGRARGRLRRAEIYNAQARAAQAHENRTNSAANFSLIDADLVQIAVQRRIAAAAGAPFQHLEAPAVLNYAPGERFAEHFDFIDPRTPGYEALIARDGQRAATMLVYLNADYEGGETAFPRLHIRFRGEACGALYFANVLEGEKADVRTVHAGEPTASGEKWVMSQFIRSRPALPGASGGGFFQP